MVRVAIIGANSYTGIEAIEILLKHPSAKITYLAGLREQFADVSDVFGQLRGRLKMPIEILDVAKAAAVADVAFCCLPHKVAMTTVPQLLEAGLKVIDFSADYRLKDPNVYAQYYEPHTDLANLRRAVYGLPELFREAIKKAELVANPGCYPTSAALAAAPLLAGGFIKTTGIVINAVSGVSGGGKNPTPQFHFPFMNENFYPYAVGTHRHQPEIEQTCSDIAQKPVSILFQPHVGPFDRGILSSVYADLVEPMSAQQIYEVFCDFYQQQRFVQVVSKPPFLKDVAKTNYCHIYATVVKQKAVIFSAIDNLVKGASGQAVQNMNLMFNLPEAIGLE